MGGAVEVPTAIAIASAVAGTTTTIVNENNKRRDALKQAKRKQEIDEKNRRNILEEQLARRRAIIGSMGISSTGSVLSSQNKLVSDSYKNMNYGSYNSDALNYAKMGNNILNGISDVSKMIK